MRYCVLFSVLLLLFKQTAQADDLRGDTIQIGLNNLKLDFTQFNSQVLYGKAEIGIRAKMNGVGGIHLDLLQLSVDSVKVNGMANGFAYNDSVLDIDFANALNNNDSATLQIFYSGTPVQPSGDFGGFYWTSTFAFNMGVSFLADNPCFGKVWFPCFDNFTVRSYYEYYVTTLNNKKAFCNGLLIDTTHVDSASTTWHWKLTENIPSYLASVTVGPFATLYDTVHAALGTLPIQIGAQPTDTANVKHFFQHLRDDVRFLENHWGPYRWERVGYCLVPFSSGAMEHATNISFMQYYLNLAADGCEQTVAHELSHHWFGDLVTCQNASEMWLNEGWASFNEILFFESIYSADSAKKVLRDFHFGVQQTAQVDDGGYLAVNGVPRSATYGPTVYRKGADVIHTLRWYMGDSLFFSSVRQYLNHYAWGNGNTLLLRDYLIQASGIDLHDYFDDWVQSPGFPHFSIEHKEVASNGTDYSVQLQVRQRLRHAPHYYNHVPVKISYFNWDMSRVDETIMMNGECAENTTTLHFNPAYVAVDFDENLQDAISDEWKILKTAGTYNYNIGLMKVVVNSITDSVLLRIEHNWIPADAMYQPIPDLHLHNYRYWTVDGIFDTTFKANATITYDGTNTSTMDSSFLHNSEDSLVMMYRPEQDSDWRYADSFYVNKQGSATNKKGQITIYNIKHGEYAMAIYNTNEPTETNNRISCKVSVDIHALTYVPAFTLYPNPTTSALNINYDRGVFERAEIHDLLGRKIIEQKINEQQNTSQFNLSNILAGTYIATLTTKGGQHVSKKIIKE